MTESTVTHGEAQAILAEARALELTTVRSTAGMILVIHGLAVGISTMAMAKVPVAFDGALPLPVVIAALLASASLPLLLAYAASRLMWRTFVIRPNLIPAGKAAADRQIRKRALVAGMVVSVPVLGLAHTGILPWSGALAVLLGLAGATGTWVGFPGLHLARKSRIVAAALWSPLVLVGLGSAALPLPFPLGHLATGMLTAITLAGIGVLVLQWAMPRRTRAA